MSMSSVSPRSSALSRGSLKRSCRDMSDFTERIEANILPILLLVAVVAAAGVAWVARNYETVTAKKAWAATLQSGVLAGVTLLSALGCAAWATAHAYVHADHTTRMVLLALFAALCVLFGVAAWMFFRRDDVSAAFYLMVVAVAVSVVHAYLCWRLLETVGVAAMVPVALMALFLVWQFWPTPAVVVTTTA